MAFPVEDFKYFVHVAVVAVGPARVADEFGVNIRTVSRWEEGRGVPPGNGSLFVAAQCHNLARRRGQSRVMGLVDLPLSVIEEVP